MGGLTFAGSTSKNLDALPNHYLSTLPTRDNATITYLGAQVPNPFQGLAPAGTSLFTNSTIARSSLLTPYPLFTGNCCVRKQCLVQAPNSYRTTIVHLSGTDLGT